MKFKIKHNKETTGMVCGNCEHSWRSHNLFIDTEIVDKILSKCRFCNCDEISEG